tara:strand:+ start:23195 stop:24079 length:885 start_codon:yes stop_codon:yes gene_type:complete
MKGGKTKIHIFAMTEKGLDVVKQLPSFIGLVDFMVTIGIDKNVQNDFSEDIGDICIKHQIPYEICNKSSILEADYSIAIGWRWLINVEHPLIVFHDSLLPKYRGFNPLVSALINGDKTVGVTALLATEKFDEGDVFSQIAIDVKDQEKIGTVISRLAEKYSLIFSDLIADIINGKLSFVPQDESKASYSVWRDEDDYIIDWSLNNEIIQRTINAVGFPYLGARTRLNGEFCRIYECKLISGLTIENNSPGKVLFIENGEPIVLCGVGAIKIITACYEGDNTSILPFKKLRSRFS